MSLLRGPGCWVCRAACGPRCWTASTPTRGRGGGCWPGRSTAGCWPPPGGCSTPRTGAASCCPTRSASCSRGPTSGRTRPPRSWRTWSACCGGWAWCPPRCRPCARDTWRTAARADTWDTRSSTAACTSSSSPSPRARRAPSSCGPTPASSCTARGRSSWCGRWCRS